MAHLRVPQNQALGVCGGFVPDIQVCGTHGREDLVNATITSNTEEEEEEADQSHRKGRTEQSPCQQILQSMVLRLMSEMLLSHTASVSYAEYHLIYKTKQLKQPQKKH